MKTEEKAHKKYLIALEEKRSILALGAGILVLFCTLAAEFVEMGRYNSTGEYPLHYFTLLSNLFSAIGVAFMIPYAVEGIRKKRFTLPRWVVLFQYAGATSVAITMVAALAIILPVQGSEAVTGTNFWLHVITPILTVVLFQCVESGVAFTRKDMLIALIPFWIYTAVYYVMVIVIGQENGGWSDFYKTQAFIPVWLSVLLMLAIGFVLSALLRFIQNRRAAKCWERITKAWSDDLEPTEILIEVFGLGRYIGAHSMQSELNVPVDLFEVIRKRYGVSAEKLIKAYVRGALDSKNEK